MGWDRVREKQKQKNINMATTTTLQPPTYVLLLLVTSCSLLGRCGNKRSARDLVVCVFVSLEIRCILEIRVHEVFVWCNFWRGCWGERDSPGSRLDLRSANWSTGMGIYELTQLPA